MGKLPKALKNRIEEVNTLLSEVDKKDILVYSYFGGTWPEEIDTAKPIKVGDRFVWDYTSFTSIERYNINDALAMADFKYNLTHVKRALKKALLEA